jgi:SAM-dependent methyltransferase
MAVESKPLFHPEVMRQQVRGFNLPEHVAACQLKLQHWADLIASGRADEHKETELLPDFLTDIFCGLLGYTSPAGEAGAYTLSRERHVEVDGKFADAVLGRFGKGKAQFITVVEGKGTRDPLDRPFAGRRMSAVDQAYRYAINLPCDWIIVTSMRETRLYYKGAQQNTYERFETVRLAADEALLKRFVFLLGAERIVPAHRDCHLYELLRASETVGRELTNQFYALYADIRQRVLTRLCRENAAVAPPEILRCTQKLLDRVLFCAFCECRGLLPAESLKHAFEHRDPYNPHPVWHNFRGLFRAIDEGNAGLNIPAYNGGLFALDPALDALQVPDEVCAHFKELGDYDYRPAREVADAAETTAVRSVIDVDILGHIFEQSITDLERLRESLTDSGAAEPLTPSLSPSDGAREARHALGLTARTTSLSPSDGERVPDRAGEGQAATPEPVSAPVEARKIGRRRKQEGAVYTPAFITRYLVEQALGGVLKARFETLRQQHEGEAAGTARKALADPNAYDLTALNDPQRKALIRFWEAWQEELKHLRILDLACGSGAILIEAFNQLHAVYELSNARLEELRGQRTLFDLDRQILQHNVYGVDLNAEAIQICQLSLWIKTAARGKQLTSLDHTIREGNSVISDPAVHPKAFDWQAAFPEVFAQGGPSNFAAVECWAGAGQHRPSVASQSMPYRFPHRLAGVALGTRRHGEEHFAMSSDSLEGSEGSERQTLPLDILTLPSHHAAQDERNQNPVPRFPRCVSKPLGIEREFLSMPARQNQITTS